MRATSGAYLGESGIFEDSWSNLGHVMVHPVLQFRRDFLPSLYVSEDDLETHRNSFFSNSRLIIIRNYFLI